MIDASKLPTAPAASDPARAGKPIGPEAKADETQFVRAPDGAGYVRGHAALTGARTA